MPCLLCTPACVVVSPVGGVPPRLVPFLREKLVKRLWLCAAALTMAAGLTGSTVMHRGTAAPVHAAILPTPDDSLHKLVLKFHVVGSFESLDPSTGVVTFSFTGPFGASQIDPVTGVVKNSQTGPRDRRHRPCPHAVLHRPHEGGPQGGFGAIHHLRGDPRKNGREAGVSRCR